jgi:hypothetical protein
MSLPTITLPRGSSLTIPVKFTDPNGLPVDISSYTVYFTVKKCADDIVDDSSAVLKYDVSIHTNAVLGETAIVIAAADCANIEIDTFNYDIILSDGVTVVPFGRGILKTALKITNRAT